jgi:antitoxin Phd
MTRANTKAKDRSWQLQEAKSRLSQVVDHALREGPQTITLRGKPAVVVVSFEEFQNLTCPSTSLREFFRQSPLYGTDLDLDRSKDVSREVPL